MTRRRIGTRLLCAKARRSLPVVPGIIAYAARREQQSPPDART
jgi:hypothetical protein